jgi:hypothetical protein
MTSIFAIRVVIARWLIHLAILVHPAPQKIGKKVVMYT